MKILKYSREIVVSVGIILLALRLFYPIKEYVVISNGIRINPEKISQVQLNNMDKEVNTTMTALQACGIGILILGFIFISKPKPK